MSRPILAHWHAYRLEVIPDDAGPVQLDECQKAFFAGAIAGLAALVTAGKEAVVEELNEVAADASRKAGVSL